MLEQKQIVKLIRSLMRLKGRREAWNNLYPSGVRTIKCYRHHDFNKDTELFDLICENLNKLGIKFHIKYTEPSDSVWAPGLGGFIVKLLP